MAFSWIRSVVDSFIFPVPFCSRYISWLVISVLLSLMTLPAFFRVLNRGFLLHRWITLLVGAAELWCGGAGWDDLHPRRREQGDGAAHHGDVQPLPQDLETADQHDNGPQGEAVSERPIKGPLLVWQALSKLWCCYPLVTSASVHPDVWRLDRSTSLPSWLHQLVRLSIHHTSGWTLPLVMSLVCSHLCSHLTILKRLVMIK